MWDRDVEEARMNDTTTVGYCLNCGDKAYVRDGCAARHADTHEIACPMAPDARAALGDE
jgi:hypothetical protein